jgi:hypothetical protein
MPPDDYHPVRQAERLTNAHVRGTKAGPVRQAVRLRAATPASNPGMSDGVPPANRGTPRGR